MGDQVYLIALPWLVYTQTHSGPILSIVYSAGMVPYILFGVLGGAASDRGTPRRALAAANGIAAVLTGILVAYGALDLRSGGTALVIVVALLLSSATSYSTAIAESLVPQVVPDQARLTAANSYIELSNSVAQVVGPPLGGVLIAVLTVEGSIAVDAGSFALAAMIFLSLRLPVRAPLTPVAGSRLAGLRQIIDGALYAPRDPVLRIAIIASTVNNIILGAYDTLVILVLRVQHHLSASATGLVLGAGGLAAVGSTGLLLPRLRNGRPGRRMIIGLGLAGAGTILVAVTDNIALLALSQMLYAGSTTLFNVTWRALRQSISPPEMLGRVIGFCRGVAYVGAAVGGLVSALFLYLGVAPDVLFACDGAVVVAAAVLCCASPLYRAVVQPDPSVDVEPSVQAPSVRSDQTNMP
jgi:MFS family permease